MAQLENRMPQVVLANHISNLLYEIRTTVGSKDKIGEMPGNAYFMADGSALCCERAHGESRYPYAADGYLLWAHSTGHIQAKSGLFNVFKPVYDSAEPTVEFFAGMENPDGTWFPISLMGAAKQLFEPFSVERYVVYTLSAAYYITDTPKATFAVRVSMSPRKELVFSVSCINKTGSPLEFSLTSYFNPLLKDGEYDSMWSNLERCSKYYQDGTFVLSREVYIYELENYYALVLNRKISGATLVASEATTSRESFCGSLRQEITNAKCLKAGHFIQEAKETENIAAEILRLEVSDCARVDYVLPLVTEAPAVASYLHQNIDSQRLDKEIESFEESERERFSQMKLQFTGFHSNDLNETVFNRFVRSVQKQVDNCAMGKYYADNMMGIRDVYQQLEQAMLWDQTQAREKMLRALSFLDPSGRAPRQFSVPVKDEIPVMDLREFVDQGNWILSCFYSYLAWTGDYGILKEELGYWEIVEEKTVRRSSLRDSVLEHLIKITDFLDRNIDREEGTHCLRALYGDWNDAMDGLGKTNDPNKKFGTGVSVMASLHFYQNLWEMSEILKLVGGYEVKANYYLQVRDRLAEGLKKYAVEENCEGQKRLVHGWGDHLSYKIGSFCDPDGLSRISFAPNAFWASSGLVRETPGLAEVIKDSLHSLESRFGLMTLKPYFDGTSGVGRIKDMIKGIAENECVYVHGALFSVLALFAVGDTQYAWKQLCKVLPITNTQITKTPFVMPNSYLDNPERGLNGQSHIDWYTGAGTVLLKILVRYVIGLNPDLHGITVQTAKDVPCDHIQADMMIHGYNIHLEYKRNGTGIRKIYLDGEPLDLQYDALMQVEKAYILNGQLHENAVITVCE